MRTVRLAYRDENRTPVIFCIKELDDAGFIDNFDRAAETVIE